MLETRPFVSTSASIFTSPLIRCVRASCGYEGATEDSNLAGVTFPPTARGLAGAFGGDARAEAEHHHAELRRAAENLRRSMPDLRVEGYFVDFEGVWSAELELVLATVLRWRLRRISHSTV